MSSTMEKTGIQVQPPRLFMCKVCRAVVTKSDKSSHAKSHKEEEEEGPKKDKKAVKRPLQPVTEVTLFGPVAASSSSTSEAEKDDGPVLLGPQPNAKNEGQNNIVSSPAVAAVVDEILLRNLPNKSGCSSRRTAPSKKSPPNARGTQNHPSNARSLAASSRGGRKSRNGTLQPETEVTLIGPVTASPSEVEDGRRAKNDGQNIIGVFTPAFLDELLVASKPGYSLKRKTPATPAKNTQSARGSKNPSKTPNLGSTRRGRKKPQSTLSKNIQKAGGANPTVTQEEGRRRKGLGPGGRIGLIQVLEEYHYPIPLLSVQVKARVLQVIAEVVVTQVYQNKERQPIEAIYYFPTNPEGAVTHFEAEVDGRIVTGKVKPNEEAQADFDAAVRSKNSAFLGEEVEPDIFKLRVGYLKPGSQAKVTIKYVTEVKHEPSLFNGIRFYIPTTIAPRYVSPEDEGDKKAEEMARMMFTPDSPVVPLSIHVHIFLDGGIEQVYSPNHKITVSTGGVAENPSWSTAYVSLASDTTRMNRDFVLDIRRSDPHRPSLHIANKDGWTAAMLHLLPSFKLEEQKSELIFVLDRSGSMEGQSMDLAKEALRLFLHSMPPICYFNIVGFGSTFKLLFPASAKYSDRTLKQAIKHAKGVKADLGGTELLQPLKRILNKPPVRGYLRQVFVLTDGQVENTERVIGLVQANSQKARVFSLGIGEAASHHLVEGLAKAGGGTAAFVALNERMDVKVLNQLKNALHPSIGAIQLAWEGVEPQEEGPPVINNTRTLLGFNKPQESTPPRSTPLCLDNGNRQSPNHIPPLHDGSQMLVFGLFQSQIPTAVTITARAPGGPLTLLVNKSPANFIETSGLIHTLAAIKLIRELELEDAAEIARSSLDKENAAVGSSSDEALLVSQERQNRKQKIIEIACRNGLTSKYTSFVAVDPGNGRPSSESWAMMATRRHVPNELAHGWGGNCMEETPIIPLPPLPPRKEPRRECSPGNCRERYCKNWVCRRNNLCGGGPPTSYISGMLRLKKASTAAVSRQKKPAKSSSSESESDEECVNGGGGGAAVVLRLAKHQSFDGSFSSSSKVLSRMVGAPILGLEVCNESRNNWKRMRNYKRTTSTTLDLGSSATALAIVVFETKLASRKPSWELIVWKARYWLGSNLPADVTIRRVLHAASEYVNGRKASKIYRSTSSSSDDEF